MFREITQIPIKGEKNHALVELALQLYNPKRLCTNNLSQIHLAGRSKHPNASTLCGLKRIGVFQIDFGCDSQALAVGALSDEQ